jgi:hypothetical protein
MCAAVGWQVGIASLTATGTVVCPRCTTPVDAVAVRRGIVEIAAHPPADAVTCSSCGTIHAHLACPGCGRGVTAADALLHGLSFPPVDVSALVGREATS